MLNVFILEDDPVQLQQIKDNVQRISEEFTVTCSIHPFTTIEELKASLPVPSVDNLYILDLEIDGIKDAGLAFSRKIRSHDQLATLIFITVHDEFLYQTYKYRVSALDFIAKDYGNIYEELRSDIKQVLAKITTNNYSQPFSYKDYSNTINIDFMNINYFETNSTNSHSAILNTVNNHQRQLNYNLHDIEKMDSRFFRAHRSYLINPYQVKDVDTRAGIIHFYNGAACPVSKLHLRSLLRLIVAE